MKLFEIYNDIIKEETENVFYHGSPHVFDKFDMSKIGSGDGLNKFGYGFYFTDNPDMAIYYAKELSKGELRNNGFNLYTVKLYNLIEYYPWEDETPEEVVNCIIRKLRKRGDNKTADLIIQEYEEYGNYWSIRTMYEILTHSLGSQKEVSEWFNICGISGVVADAITHKGKIYTAFDDSLIKIIDVKKIR